MATELLRAEDPVVLPEHGPTAPLWMAVLDLAEAHPRGWTLIGAMMVALHEHEAGQPSGRLTADADAVVEARGATSGPRALAQTLLTQGWRIHDDDVDINRVGYTFRRGRLAFDLTVPEGLGPRTDVTTVPPLTAPPLSGARQAIDRTEQIAVVHGQRCGQVPRPSLLAAIVLKSCAAAEDRSAASGRHLDDLARLYRLIAEPSHLAPQLTKKDRQRLRGAGDPPWEVIDDPVARTIARRAHKALLAS